MPPNPKHPNTRKHPNTKQNLNFTLSPQGLAYSFFHRLQNKNKKQKQKPANKKKFPRTYARELLIFIQLLLLVFANRTNISNSANYKSEQQTATKNSNAKQNKFRNLSKQFKSKHREPFRKVAIYLITNVILPNLSRKSIPNTPANKSSEKMNTRKKK